ncbi:hypothetical protein PYW07_001400 [Mythimna separata]|uniref:receptor protein-tyrosine kinase n=1 Tax=Mythimna separata TaxID=271217 RepID=A0AAD8DWS3_MYTSE|nr:hypothetical protein PYW07_001400 [Mythimna separata]
MPENDVSLGGKTLSVLVLFSLPLLYTNYLTFSIHYSCKRRVGPRASTPCPRGRRGPVIPGGPRAPAAHMPRYRLWHAVVCGALVACALAQQPAGAADGAQSVRVMPVTLGAPDVGAALGALAVAALAARGVAAELVAAPAACAAPASDDCSNAVLRALATRAVHAALLPVPAAHPLHALRLRDVGLSELGDVTPAARLACHARAPAPAARSLLDFGDAAAAAQYRVPHDALASALHAARDTDPFTSSCFASNCSSFSFTPEWCSLANSTCATLLVDDDSEARILVDVVRANKLYTSVVAVGAHLLGVAERLAAAAPPRLLLCSRSADRAALARLHFTMLAPPPCYTTAQACAFDPYRLSKVVNERELHSPSVISILGRLELTEIELRNFIRQYRLSGPTAAVSETLARHGKWTQTPREARTAVMVPASTLREAFDASALRAAAVLAEQDSPASDAVCFKVELLDDQCKSTLAFKYLTDALGAEFGALSGVAGPACGAAFADVARQSPTLALPVLGYTAQAPPPAHAADFAVLAGGDARLLSRALAAHCARWRWRRVAVLSELATRAALDLAELDVIVHVELPADTDDVDYDNIAQWARRVAAANGRVLYVSAEDARVVRAALCAGRAAGLAPAAGAVWLLPAALPPAWLAVHDADRHNCTQDQLLEAADGHFSVAPAWLAAWDERTPDAAQRAWTRRWRAQCCVQLGGCALATDCARAPAHAALLYDALRMWDDALRRQLHKSPAALDNLHRGSFARALINDVTTVNYTGLTGEFQWSREGALARAAPLVLTQWLNGTRRRVATWTPRGGYAAAAAAPHWLTADARAPDDGAERCALQPLADVLRAGCRTAFVALGALLLALLVAALAAAAWHCKRRAERKYRERLAALGLTRLSPKPGGLDRWEIPRERVVINRKLGTGAFGTVYGGHALLAEDRGWSAVAVKTLKAGASTEEKLDFLSEAEAMKRFDHKNVVRLLGVVTNTEPVCTVMEFMLYGDLKNYLLARRHLAAGEAGDAGSAEVSAARLTAMALDAARALSYLAQLRYVHRDVAARNCLVSAHRVVKLADFGMTRLVFENDYYRFSRKGMLPVRWMAPESLALGVFSPASDVWSFGVLLYEIVTFGSLPFQGLSNAEVLARVKAGHTLELPPGLKPQLEGLIKSCWQQEHKARPCAAEVAAFLADSPRLLAPCLDVPLDALPLDHADLDPWRVSRDRAEARWVSWAAPASAATDTTYLSDAPPPHDTDAFLP